MTMIIGFNLGNTAYISADTRVTKDDRNKYEDDIQKIELIRSKGVVIAAAGDAMVASEFVSAIKTGKLTIPVHKEQLESETKSIIEEFRVKYSKLKRARINPLGEPIALLFQYVRQGSLYIVVYRITFMKENMIVPEVCEFTANPGEFVEFGSIGQTENINVGKIPKSVSAVITPSVPGKTTPYRIPYEVNIEITERILDVARLNRGKTIGGKVTTLMTYRIEPNKLASMGIKGFRTVTHSDDEYEDVSTYTNFNPETGLFYIRDARKDGMDITHIKKAEDGSIKLYYDSCAPVSGGEDYYFRLFSEKYKFRPDMDDESLSLKL